MNKQNCREGYRICIQCKVEKILNVDNYYKDKNRALGFMYRCKDCDRKRVDNRCNKERWLNISPEAKIRIKAKQKRYGQTEMGRAISLLGAYKYTDKKKSQFTTITKEEVLIARQSLCSYCGAPATGFDRKDNAIGHTKENCVPACTECNVGRMDNFTHEEMDHLGEAIRLIKAKREKMEYGNCIF